MDGFGVIGTSDKFNKAEQGVDRVEVLEEKMALF